jgi:flavin reductase (DIM6/NTAB) family NADH-FMN oxidoreductase RutF
MDPRDVPVGGGNDLRAFMGAFPTGVSVVTTRVRTGEPYGLTCSSLASVTLDPPTLLVCISKANRTIRTAQRATSLVVHYLGTGDEPLARLFGETTGDDEDKFDQCTWTERPDGTVVLDGCRGWVAGEVVSRTDVGDHVAVALRVTAAEARDPEAGQLGFQRVKDFDPGHPA